VDALPRLYFYLKFPVVPMLGMQWELKSFIVKLFVEFLGMLSLQGTKSNERKAHPPGKEIQVKLDPLSRTLFGKNAVKFGN
jgi:hypothetical protein